MSITIDELNILIIKSKNKKDGVYSKGLYYYGVKDNNLLLIAHKFHGEIQQLCYGFLVTIGNVERYELQKEIKRLLLSNSNL